MARPEFTIYKGDTFLANGLYRTALGVPVDLPGSGIAVEAFLKTRNNGSLPIDVNLGAQTGAYTLQAGTDAWPIGRNLLVIRYTQGGIRRTATPVIVNVKNV